MTQPIDLSETCTQERLHRFASFMQDIQRQVGFKVSARGWCYQLEQVGLVTKGQFDKAETWINRARRRGILPIDFVAEEPARAFQGIEVPHNITPEEHAVEWLEAVLMTEEYYTPDWWDGEEYYLQMLVEKIDLITLFRPVCAQYKIPIATSKGWGSMLQRAEYARRFREHEEAGRRCVLLYCGDHDPDGLRIAEHLRSNLEDLNHINWSNGDPGYDPSMLQIFRFGLDREFIQEHQLTWIDNLETGSGKNLASPKHRNHKLPYVQEYLSTVGERKCEANALVTIPAKARQMCEATITSWLGDDAKRRIEKKRQRIRRRMKKARREIGLEDTIRKAIEAFQS